jgi:hypothetical protein
VAWSAPIAVVATAAPAFAASEPPVVASQCGVACKHPGTGQNDKAYHFTFCFKATGAVDGNTVSVTTMKIGDDCRPAFVGENNKNVTVVANSTTCVYVDAPFFTESSSDKAILYFTYAIGGVTFQGCANATIIGDVCGTGQSPLKDNPKNWPHDAGIGSAGIVPCATVTQTPCDASTPCTAP